jgi:hypothetical protein
VDRNEILDREGIFLNVQQPGSPEIDYTESLQHTHYLTDAVVLRARSVIHQIAQLNVIVGAPVVGIYYRKPIQSI